MIVRSVYENYQIKVSGNILEVTCELEGQLLTRVYEFHLDSKDFLSVHCNGQYVILYRGRKDGGGCHQLKFESNHEIIGDTFNDVGEHVESFACHDFYDDVIEIED